MREDMNKVIVERPRRGGGRGDGRYHRDEQRAKDDPESAPSKLPLRPRGQRTKHLNENLAPLRRFLFANVGRPWDRVKSEIHERISPRNAVQQHILQHIPNFVVEQVELVDSVPHHYGPGGLQPVAGRRREMLYVCPRTGLLKIAKPPRAMKQVLRMHRLDDEVIAVHWKGCWHLARMKELPVDAFYAFDAYLGREARRDDLAATWGKAHGVQFVASLHALTRDEIRRLPFDTTIARS